MSTCLVFGGCHCQDAEVPRHVAAAVMTHYGFAGIRSGGMDAALIDAIVRMDPGNRYRAFLAFPGHVAAVDLASLHDDGIHRLSVIAGPAARDDDLTPGVMQALVHGLEEVQIGVERAKTRRQAEMLKPEPWWRADAALREALSATREILQELRDVT